MKRIRFLLVLINIATLVIQGFRSGCFTDPLLADSFLQYCLPFMLVSLMLVDARVRDIQIPRSTHWLFLLSSVVSCPAYVLWSRGWRGAFLLLTIVLVFVAAQSAGYYLAVATVGR